MNQMYKYLTVSKMRALEHKAKTSSMKYEVSNSTLINIIDIVKK